MSKSEYDKELQQFYEEIVSKAITEVKSSLLSSDQGFKHSTFFGAMHINPQHLAIWYFFTKDSDLKNAEETHLTKEIINATRENLKRNGYPDFIVPSIIPSFASDEEVQRDYGGNYRNYLQ